MSLIILRLWGFLYIRDEGHRGQGVHFLFFPFLEPIPIFSYFKTKTSYFSYFLAVEVKIVTKLKVEFLVVCVFRVRFIIKQVVC